MQRNNVRKEKIKKLLVFGPNWIGDTIMSTPMLSSLRKAFPSVHIVMVVKPYAYDLWKWNPFVDEIWTFKAPRIYNIFAYLKLFWKIKKNQFDLTIILPHCLRYALITFLVGIPHRVGYNVAHRGVFLTHTLEYNLSLRKKHMVDNYLDILKAISIEPRSKDLILDIDLNSQAKAEKILEDNHIHSEDLVIGIAPGAIYGEAKRWPKERYAELADNIIGKYNAKVLIFTGVMERKLGEEIKKSMRYVPIMFNGNITLLETAALIKRCNLFITNDSGLMHIAASVKTKIIAIFGSTSPDWTGPYGDGHMVIRKKIDCSPCFERKCHLKTYICLKSVNVKDVLETVQIQLKKRLCVL